MTIGESWVWDSIQGGIVRLTLAVLRKRSEREVFTDSLGQTDCLTLCTELNLASRTPSSGGLANPGRVGAALRSLGNCGGRGGEEVPQAAMLLCYSVVSDMLL